MKRIQKGKCWFEVYRNGRPIEQDSHSISRKWLSWKSVKDWVLRHKKWEGNQGNYEILPYCPHKTPEECCNCTKDFDVYGKL